MCSSYFSPGDLSTWTMSWKNGRELATASNGTHTLSYDYDVNGLRTYKIVDGVRHDYVYASGKLLREEWTESESGEDLDCSMEFFYDYAGNPYVVFISRGTDHQRFYYMTNLQGDVIGILNTSAELVAEYDYDPYGNLISFTGSSTGTELEKLIGQVNPLRYRGYYFDQETGFYYLQSRYYDPALGRFINADTYSSTGQGFLGYNMFAYCGNNPVCNEDQNGELFNTILGAIVGGVVAVLTHDENESWDQALLRGATTGAIAGAALDISIATGGVAAPLAIAAGGGFASSFIDSAWEDTNNGNSFDFWKCFSNGIIGALTNVAFSQASKAAKPLEKKGAKEVVKRIWHGFDGAQKTKSGRLLLNKAARKWGENLFGTSAQAAGNKVFSLVIDRAKELLN